MAVTDRLITIAAPGWALRRGRSLSEQGQTQRAFPLLHKAARAGIAEAAFLVGRCYLEGAGVPVDPTQAARWLTRAADQGFVAAQAMLASLFVHGLASVEASAGSAADRLFGQQTSGQPDFVAAEKWARRAAEAGSAEAQAVLGYILTSGPEGQRKPEEARRWYEQSAASGCPPGHLGYALALARDEHTPDQQEQIVGHLQHAAEAKLPTALYLLGSMSERGVGLPRDRAAANRFYREGAEQGHAGAQMCLGLALLAGDGIEADPIEGESWLRRSALAGNPAAAARLGELYARGGALPPNYAEAVAWFRQAAVAGHGGAARALGMLHLTGAGVERDAGEAARWFRIAAETGDRESQVDLGNMVLEGSGGEIRPREWFEPAALAGDLEAAFNLGVCLAQGVGIERDDRKAAAMLRRAADGVASAQFWYARMLIDGRGVDADPEAARDWLERAAAAGMTEAAVLLAEMFLHGSGGPKDDARAMALFEQAAERGHVGAMFAMGGMRAGGHDVPADAGESRRWFQAAAERGHAYAQMMLGRYCANGIGGPRDPDRARHWLAAAAGQGLPEARAELASLPGADADAGAARPEALAT